jgi:RNA polymerase subunit RPABC4/transcription elongation factor Spt4
VMYTWQLDHPQVVYGAKALDEWIESGAYDNILGGRYAQDTTGGAQMGAQRRCQGCDAMVSATVRFCPNCGSDVTGGATAAASPGDCAKCGGVLAVGAKFCADCGAPVP